MGIFRWNDAHLLGLRLFDSEHKTIFALADELNESIVHGENARTQKNHLKRLVNTFVTHFEHEERLMAHYRYSDMEEDVDEHRALMDQLSKMKQKLDAGAVALPLDSLQPLRNWLDRHIRRYDQPAARYIRQNEMVGLGV